MKVSIILLLGIILILINSSIFFLYKNKLAYELGDQCASAARSFVKTDYLNISEKPFTVHYSKKLNKCFAKVNESNSLTHEQSFTIYDVSELRSVASYYSFYDPKDKDSLYFTCFVHEEEKCDTSYDFERLTKKFMES